MSLFPVTDVRMEEMKIHSQEDETCQQLMNYCNDCSPEKHFLKGPLKAYQLYQAALGVQDDILMSNSHILVPSALRRHIRTYPCRTSRNSQMPTTSQAIHMVARHEPTKRRHG